MVETRAARAAKDAAPPKLDTSEIMKGIPAHLFQGTVAQSMYYVIRELFFMISLAYGYYYSSSIVASTYGPVASATLLIAYALIQGTIFWGSFVLAHECGHGSFSKYSTLNDIVGTILNGIILVPYMAWKITHNIHHKNTGNIDRDEIFYPVRESEHKKQGLLATFLQEKSFFSFGLSWIFYLLGGARNREVDAYGNPQGVAVKSTDPSSTMWSHFDPYVPIFKQHRFGCTMSTIAVGSMLTLLVSAAQIYGWSIVLQMYFAPFAVGATWLVVVTFLHHMSEETSWLSNDKWTYAQGQILNTVDRDYGYIINNLIHNIGTHVVHHIFYRIPHYNLVEATKYLDKWAAAKGIKLHKQNFHVTTLLDFFKMYKLHSQHYVIPDDCASFSWADVATARSD